MVAILLAWTTAASAYCLAPSRVLGRCSSSVQMVTALPAEIEALGCDEELWGSINQKSGLLKLVAAGDLEHARSRIEKIRAIVADPEAHERTRKTTRGQPMPSELSELGCDEELWQAIDNKVCVARDRMTLAPFCVRRRI